METKPETDVATEAANVLNECVKLASNIPSKKSKELRKNEEKSSEQLMKFLNSNHSAEEKLAVVSKKYFEAVDENRKFQALSKQWEKKYVLMQRERDHTQLEYNKAVLLKSKLENLCRELQKQIKAVKEESLLKIKEEEEKLKDTLAIFKNTITELTTAVQQNNEKNMKLRDTNTDFKEKFKNVMEQYELREQQVEKITKQMALEAQLSEAKLAKANLEAQAEKEKLLAEKKQLLTDLTQYQARCNELQANSVNMQSQIAMYTNKYNEFQTLLTRSSEVFGGVKGEMEKVTKQVEKQEKEANIWKERWEKSHMALLDIAAEKQKMESMFSLQERKLNRMQNICRTMQAQRTVLLNALKENNIESPTLPQAPPPEPDDKVDILAANCAQLKQSLSQLQGQLNDLTDRKKTDVVVEPEPTVQKKPKKGKGKKNKGAKDINEVNEEAQNLVDAKSKTKFLEIENQVESLMKNVCEILPIQNEITNLNDDVSKLTNGIENGLNINDPDPVETNINNEIIDSVLNSEVQKENSDLNLTNIEVEDALSTNGEIETNNLPVQPSPTPILSKEEAASC